MNAFSPVQIDPAFAALGSKLGDPFWRVTSGELYKIMTKERGVIPFVPNPLQLDFIESMEFRECLLKCRQVGFTTAISILWLDHALFVPDQRCAQIAQNLDKAKEIFRDKVRFAYEHLPPVLKALCPTRKQTESELLFDHNNSNVYVDVSVRGGTIHKLHVSEYGSTSVHSPNKAIEIRTGGFPAVPATGCIVLESTAEGTEGEFYDIATQAEKRAADPAPLHPKEWHFRFYAWWEHDEYETDPEGIAISTKDHAYFDEIEGKIIAAGKRPVGFKLSLRKRAWYVATRNNDFSGKASTMWPEHPSIPEEAWLRSPEGVIFAEELAELRASGRVRPVQIVSYSPVNTFWDIGSKDGTGVWVHQHVAPWHRLKAYFEGWFKGYSYFIAKLDAFAAEQGEGFTWGTHYVPHDATHKRQMQHTVCSPLEMLQELKPHWRFEVVPPIDELQHGHQALRRIFNLIEMDPDGCKEGLIHLDNYRYRRNTQTGGWMAEPVKNNATEAADSLRQLGQAWESLNHLGTGMRRPKRRGAAHLS